MIAILMCLVVGVADGDTLTVLCNGSKQVKIRLSEIDAPEKRQPFGNRSKKSLSVMCLQKKAKIKPVELLDAVIKIIDKYPINSDDTETSNPIVTVKSFEKMKPEIIISESYSYNK